MGDGCAHRNEFALASTTHLHAVPLVLNNDLHHPAMLAKAIATADVLSNGRAAVGIGAGWLVDDYDALGLDYEAAPVRITRLEEALQVMTAFFAGAPVTFVGGHYRLTDLEAIPLAIQVPRPPILVGGGGARMLAVAGRTRTSSPSTPSSAPVDSTKMQLRDFLARASTGRSDWSPTPRRLPAVRRRNSSSHVTT